MPNHHTQGYVMTEVYERWHILSAEDVVKTNIYLFIIQRGCKLAVNLLCGGDAVKFIFGARA